MALILIAHRVHDEACRPPIPSPIREVGINQGTWRYPKSRERQRAANHNASGPKAARQLTEDVGQRGGKGIQGDFPPAGHQLPLEMMIFLFSPPPLSSLEFFLAVSCFITKTTDVWPWLYLTALLFRPSNVMSENFDIGAPPFRIFLRLRPQSPPYMITATKQKCCSPV